MIKLRGADGKVFLTSVPEKDTSKLMPVTKEPEKRNFVFKVNDLHIDSTTTDAINVLIVSEHDKGVIDKQQISNGEFTFAELYKLIEHLKQVVPQS